MKKHLISLSAIKLVLTSAFVMVAIERSAAQSGDDFLPVPQHAMPQDQPKEGYILQKVGKSSYVVISGIAQAGFVVTPGGVVVIDAPPALAGKLPAAIKSVTNEPVTYVIETHDHFDHIGAVTVFKGAKLVAHDETAKLLKLFPNPKTPVPSITFSGESYLLKVGGVEFRLIYPGPNHETGNIIVYVPEDKLAVLTDVVMPGWVPFRGWGNADYIPGLFKALDVLLKLDFDTFVGGHVYRTGARADVEDARAYLVDVWKETKAAMTAHPFKPAANIWAAQKVWFDQIAKQVTAKLVEKYKDRLAGTDIYTYDNVVATIVSFITDTPDIPDELLK
jgi:glyoxylase-like metal-dependent hydrolase (beta-lactamase superfamily II)